MLLAGHGRFRHGVVQHLLIVHRGARTRLPRVLGHMTSQIGLLGVGLAADLTNVCL